MPRVKLGQRDEQFEKFARLINGAVAMEGKRPADIGLVLGIDRRTAANYLKKPEELSLSRVMKLSRSLNIPIADLREVIRY